MVRAYLDRIAAYDQTGPALNVFAALIAAPSQRTGAVTEPLESAVRLRAGYGSVCLRGGPSPPIRPLLLFADQRVAPKSD
jgi:hypothetical protein